jgi:hypothetical protein
LLLAFEIGYLTLSGVTAIPINSWSDFKKVIKQLKEDKAHELYKNITLDTVDIAYDLCEKYICSQNGVETISQMPYGQGFAAATKEFDETLRQIPQLGYGLVMISHAQDKTFVDETGQEYNQIVPTLANRPRLIVDRMSDIIGYAHPEQRDDGSTHTALYMRGTPRFLAGSRFAHTPDKIEFTYENLVNAIGDAIDKQAEESDGKYVTDKPVIRQTAAPTYDFNALMKEFNTIVGQIQEATGPDFENVWAVRITEIINQDFGKGKKVKDMTPDQAEILDLIVSDLKDAVANGL